MEASHRESQETSLEDASEKSTANETALQRLESLERQLGRLERSLFTGLPKLEQRILKVEGDLLADAGEQADQTSPPSSSRSAGADRVPENTPRTDGSTGQESPPHSDTLTRLEQQLQRLDSRLQELLKQGPGATAPEQQRPSPSGLERSRSVTGLEQLVRAVERRFDAAFRHQRLRERMLWALLIFTILLLIVGRLGT